MKEKEDLLNQLLEEFSKKSLSQLPSSNEDSIPEANKKATYLKKKRVEKTEDSDSDDVSITIHLSQQTKSAEKKQQMVQQLIPPRFSPDTRIVAGEIDETQSSNILHKAESEKREVLSPLLSKKSNHLEPVNQDQYLSNRPINEVPLKRKVRKNSIMSEKIAYDNINKQLDLV